MIKPTIPTLPVPPQAGQAEEIFAPAAYAFVNALDTFGQKQNELADWVSSQAEEIEKNSAKSADAYIAAQAAIAASRYKGLWSDAAGAVMAGDVYSHDGVVWMAQRDIIDISQSEPRLSNDDWIVVSSRLTVNLKGERVVDQATSYVYQITNYSNFLDYQVSVNTGDVSIVGDQITLSVPHDAETIALTVVVDGVPSVFNLAVNQAYIRAPGVVSPVAPVSSTFSITTSAFESIGQSDVHISTDYQLATDENFENIIWSEMGSGELETISVPFGVVSPNQSYWLRVRFTGQNLGESNWTIHNFESRGAFMPSENIQIIPHKSYGAGFGRIVCNDVDNLLVFEKNNGIYVQRTSSNIDFNTFLGFSNNSVLIRTDAGAYKSFDFDLNYLRSYSDGSYGIKDASNTHYVDSARLLGNDGSEVQSHDYLPLALNNDVFVGVDKPNNVMNIYAFNGLTFDLAQTIQLPSSGNIRSIDVSDDSRVISAWDSTGKMYVFVRLNDIYQFASSTEISGSFTQVNLNADGSLAVLSGGGGVVIVGLSELGLAVDTKEFLELTYARAWFDDGYLIIDSRGSTYVYR